jgi:hypothetical protein
MSVLKEIYKTRELSSLGRFILFSLGFLLILGVLFPEKDLAVAESQIYTVSGLSTKYDDEAVVSQFLTSVKNNNGYLVLGTSETTSLPNGNYYDFLNSDKDLEETSFSVLAGAGRTCGNLIPILLEHREEARNLNLIYFINPVYWREDLCEVNLAYGQRYLNYFMTTQPDLSEDEEAKYYSPILEYHAELNPLIKASESVEYLLRRLFRNYNFHLKYGLLNQDWSKSAVYVSDRPSFGFEKEDYENRMTSIDTVFNIEESFTHKNWYKPIDLDVDYRTEELEAFISVCKDLGVNATFILGPTNERFIKSYEPSTLAGYKTISERVETLLIEENMAYIDARDINDELGAFADHQHHSSYGAFLIYQMIKKQIHDEKQ